MPYEKQKSEQYRAIGGINEKASNYALNENECLKLENLDFQEPGAYNARWGFTLAANLNTVNAVNNIWQITNNLPGFTGAGTNTIAGDKFNLQSVSLTNGNLKFILSGTPSTTAVATWSHAEASMFSYATNGSVNPISIFGLTLLNMFKIANYGNTLGLQSGVFGLPQVSINYNTATYAKGGATLPIGTSYEYRLGLYDKFTGDDISVNAFLGPIDSPTNSADNRGSVFMDRETVTFEGLSLPAGATLFNPVGWVLYRNKNSGTDENNVTISDSSLFFARATAPIGATTIMDTAGATLTLAKYAPETFYVGKTLSEVPKYLEHHLSRLWIATSSTVYFSEVSNPQSIPAFNYFPAGNEKYSITGLKTLHGNLLVFLQKGIKRIVGDGQELADGTTNFAIQDLTKEYGALSHKAIVVFQERCWFLDENAIVEFNGSNFSIVSNRIEDTMKTINYTACKEQASALHVPERREVWFSVPQNGSNFNLILVYDYVANAWTTFKGVDATCLAHLYSDVSSGQLNSPKPYFGTTLGILNVFDSSLNQDNGVGFTCLVKGRFHNELGNSVHKMFRRVYLDAPNDGVTLPVQVNLYADHATSTISATMISYVGTTFQYRNDFGVDAKSLSVEFVHSTVDSKYKIFGYTVEYRFLRKV